MKQNGTRLENKTAREITNMDRKMGSKACLQDKQLAGQHYKKNNIL